MYWIATISVGTHVFKSVEPPPFHNHPLPLAQLMSLSVESIPLTTIFAARHRECHCFHPSFTFHHSFEAPHHCRVVVNRLYRLSSLSRLLSLAPARFSLSRLSSLFLSFWIMHFFFFFTFFFFALTPVSGPQMEGDYSNSCVETSSLIKRCFLLATGGAQTTWFLLFC